MKRRGGCSPLSKTFRKQLMKYSVKSFAGGSSIAEVPETTTLSTASVRYWPVSEDPTLKQVMQLQEMSGTLSFWNDDAEDIYGPDDGEPV